MSAITPDYRGTVFQHQDLTKISGTPTYTDLALLERQCKANAQTVPSTIGNGNLGLLGLVSSALAFERSSPGVPFVRPVVPILPDLSQSTAAQIAEAHRLFKEQTISFNACNQVERTIIQQINTALDEDCLADLTNEDTGLIQGTVTEIFADLYRTFGAITPQALAQAKTALEATVYNHSKPLSNVFTAIARYADMANASGSEETTPQLVNIGLIIITRPTIFASDIRKWHDLPLLSKTWIGFKDHFKRAQRDIIRSQPAITTDTLGYHGQANAASVATVVDQVIDRLQAQQDADSAITPDSAAETLAAQQMFNLTNMANATQQMQALQSTIATLQNQVNNTRNNNQSGSGSNASGSGRRSGRSGRGGDRSGGRTGGRGGGRGDSTSRPHGPPGYCWTHGNCSHNSPDCSNKAEGHLDAATFTDMLGGNEYRCTWL
jgi:uncharacterized membrane protein YgcG